MSTFSPPYSPVEVEFVDRREPLSEGQRPAASVANSPTVTMNFRPTPPNWRGPSINTNSCTAAASSTLKRCSAS